VTVAQAPIHDAFARLWPAARIADLTDAALADDLAEAGALTDAFSARMTALVEYGVANGADGVLFTCSAFGSAIEAARNGVQVPVLKPDEAMIEAALERGSRIGGLATFEPTITSLAAELETAAEAGGLNPEIELRHVAGALDALNAGRADDHHRLVADAAAGMKGVDVLVLAQFSMVGARDAAEQASGVPVLTAPDEAVRKLKGLLGA